MKEIITWLITLVNLLCTSAWAFITFVAICVFIGYLVYDDYARKQRIKAIEEYNREAQIYNEKLFAATQAELELEKLKQNKPALAKAEANSESRNKKAEANSESRNKKAEANSEAKAEKQNKSVLAKAETICTICGYKAKSVKGLNGHNKAHSTKKEKL